MNPAFNKFYKINPENRMLNMSINALIGYLIVEIITLLLRSVGYIKGMTYGDIFLLAVIVNVGTIIFIIVLVIFRSLSETRIRLIFFAELLFFLCMYTIALLQTRELQTIALVFALVAVGIELPFTTLKESLIITFGACAAQIGVSYYSTAILEQHGDFLQSISFTIAVLPVLVILSYVAHQITQQRRKINDDRDLLMDMNDRLLDINTALEKTNSINQMEIELASQVQRMLLPPVPANVPGWDIAMSFKPKYGVSGDFYDFYYKDGQLRGMAIFDVSGHGVSSSLVTMIVKPITYRVFTNMDDKNLGSIIESVNENVSHEISLLDHFISCILLRFSGDTIEYANAGHPYLLLRSSASGAVQAMQATGKNHRGGPIGINIKKYEPAFTQFSVGVNDIILLYTDCIVESRNSSGELFGYNRLISSLHEAPSGPAVDILQFILDSFLLFVKNVEIRDDFTVIVAKKTE
jgi:serine phosphatase RsbU (regulator of sigma subunit)